MRRAGSGPGQFGSSTNQYQFAAAGGASYSFNSFTTQPTNFYPNVPPLNYQLQHNDAGLGNGFEADGRLLTSVDLPLGASSPYHQPAAAGPPGSPTASEYTPSFSSNDSRGSSLYPSQGSDFFCQASPTYEWSLPKMSKSSQGSPVRSHSQGSWSPSQSSSPRRSQNPSPMAAEVPSIAPLAALDYPQFNAFYGTRARSESGSSQSQPEYKRVRHEYEY